MQIYRRYAALLLPICSKNEAMLLAMPHGKVKAILGVDYRPRFVEDGVIRTKKLNSKLINLIPIIPRINTSLAHQDKLICFIAKFAWETEEAGWRIGDREL
jgi:hypothetical protein